MSGVNACCWCYSCFQYKLLKKYIFLCVDICLLKSTIFLADLDPDSQNIRDTDSALGIMQ